MDDHAPATLISLYSDGMKTIAGAFLAVLLAALLAGCGPSPSSTPAPTVTSSGSESPSATPEPAAQALSIPECETLLPIALARSSFGDATEFLGESPAADYVSRFDIAGADEALDVASPSRTCSWGVPNSDGAFSLVFAEHVAGERPTLEAALAASGFSSVTMGTVTGFDIEREGMVSVEAATHLFTGDVWIFCDGTTLDLTGVVAGSALDALRTANPTLSL
jgi:hypothetical protein